MPLPKTTNLFMAGYRKDPPLLPRLPDNQPNFHRQSENIHTRDTHDTPFPKQRRNTRITETPNEACNRKVSLNPERHETEQSRETPLPNTRITTKALHALQTNNSNTITKGIAHLPLLHTRRRTITKTTRTTQTKTQRRTTSRRTKPHMPVERTNHPFHPKEYSPYRALSEGRFMPT